MIGENQHVVEEAYYETVAEALARGTTPLNAHKEAVVAASMLLAALTGTEDEAAKEAIVKLGLRPPSE